MPYGFKRILDVKPLSLKTLNDQLELLWKKVLGDVTQQDFSVSLQKKMDSFATCHELQSAITQSEEGILLKTSRLGSDNLWQNGAFQSGTDGYVLGAADDIALLEGYTCLGVNGSVYRTLSLQSGIYTLSFLHQGAQGLLLVGEESYPVPQSAVWTSFSATFTLEQTASITVSFTTGGGTFYLHSIQLEKGEIATAYRSAGSEMVNSSVIINDEQVAIDTRHFSLVLRDEDGETGCVLDADEKGFDQLYVSQDIFLRGKPFLLPLGSYHAWVHPQGGGGQIGTGSTAPEVTDPCVFTNLGSVLSSLPRILDGELTIHISQEQNVVDPFASYSLEGLMGGGKLTFVPWAGISPFHLRALQVKQCNLPISIRYADFDCASAFDGLKVIGSHVTAEHCRVNGAKNLVPPGAVGFEADQGSVLTLWNCEAQNCSVAAAAYAGSRVSLSDCGGTNCGSGMVASSGGIIMAEGTSFAGNARVQQLGAGRIFDDTQGVGEATQMAAAIPVRAMETNAIRCGNFADGAWRTEAQLLTGVGAQALFWFDLSGFSGTLQGARLRLTRCPTGGSAKPIQVNLYGFANAADSGLCETAASYGMIGEISRGATVYLPLPIASIQALLDGTIGAIGITTNNRAFFNGTRIAPVPRLELIYT